MKGRLHSINFEAKEIAKRLVEKIPNERLLKPQSSNDPRKVIRTIQYPLWIKIQFDNTQKEREYLVRVSGEYKKTVLRSETLLAHGTNNAYDFAQILIDGRLKHGKSYENYGDLSFCEGNVLAGGYWDNGWGVFVTNYKTIKKCMKESKGERFLEVPLEELEAILLPEPIVKEVREEFPKRKEIIKGHIEFAQELEERMKMKSFRVANYGVIKACRKVIDRIVD